MSQARGLYKRLLRELSRHAKEAATIQNAQDAKRIEALQKYRLMQEKKSGGKPDPVSLISTSSPKNRRDLPLQQAEALRTQFQTGTEYDLVFGEEVLQYLIHQRTYKELLRRYNPGIDVDSEENMRKTAHRVGLQLPQDSM